MFGDVAVDFGNAAYRKVNGAVVKVIADGAKVIGGGYISENHH